jgi:hypothetical protein
MPAAGEAPTVTYDNTVPASRTLTIVLTFPNDGVTDYGRVNIPLGDMSVGDLLWSSDMFLDLALIASEDPNVIGGGTASGYQTITAAGVLPAMSIIADDPPGTNAGNVGTNAFIRVTITFMINAATAAENVQTTGGIFPTTGVTLDDGFGVGTAAVFGGGNTSIVHIPALCFHPRMCFFDVLKATGTVVSKAAADIRVGDRLMGPAGRVETVQAVCRMPRVAREQWVHFPVGSLAPGVPNRPIRVTPQHNLFVPDAAGVLRAVPAARLARCTPGVVINTHDLHTCHALQFATETQAADRDAPRVPVFCNGATVAVQRFDHAVPLLLDVVARQSRSAARQKTSRPVREPAVRPVLSPWLCARQRPVGQSPLLKMS